MVRFPHLLTPDGAREHIRRARPKPGLRQSIAWLRRCAAQALVVMSRAFVVLLLAYLHPLACVLTRERQGVGGNEARLLDRVLVEETLMVWSIIDQRLAEEQGVA